MQLKDKTVLITGGASGIGKIMVRLALERNAKVVIWDIDKTGIDKTIAEFSTLGSITGFVVDLSNGNEIQEVAKKVKKEIGFIDVLINAGRQGDITLYHHSFGGEFETPMTQEEAQVVGRSTDTIITFDPVTFEEIIKIVHNELNWEDINTYRVKEVYFFDEETSKLDVRILGIAPIIDRTDENGNYLNSGPLLWTYYPEVRETLARTEAFNVDNDAARMSWEDVFEARMFSGYITKESNVYDRRIKDYKTEPMAILLESDKIKEGIFHFDHDLWTY